MRRFMSLGLCVVALGGGLAACGDDEDTSSDAAETTATAEPAAPAETTPAVADAADTFSDEGAIEPISKDLTKKPKIPKPSGDTPSQLVVKDVVEGKGAAAQPGDTVQVQYVGVSFSNGKQFDASWDSGAPFDFPLGQQQVIPGWDQGVVGMKVGGRRELVIPPDLGYGAQGSPPAILPNETLVFVIDLLKSN